MGWMGLACLLAGSAHAADTFAYHFADAPWTEKPITECPLLTAAPAPTPFVATGDKASTANLTLTTPPLLIDALNTPDGRTLRQGLKVGTIRSQREP